jgi:hypothetical protein
MVELTEETEFAKNNIDGEEYISRINDIESELHKLRDELAEVEVEILQDKGYKPINIDDITIMAPVGMTIQQLHTALQQISPPKKDRKRAIKSLVSEDDRNEIHNHNKYQSVVNKRQELIDEIMDIYVEFWESEIKPISSNDDESIAYLIVGLKRDIRSRKISNITGISERKCRKYQYKDGMAIKNN